MDARLHRKTSIKQLVRLSEEHWNAPRELAIIVAELRQRDDAEAEPAIRSIVRRLSILNYRPDGTADASDDTQGRNERAERARRRRRLLLALIPAAAAAAVAAVLLWPEQKPPAASASLGGSDLAGRGDRAGHASPEGSKPLVQAELLRHNLATSGEPAGRAPRPPRETHSFGAPTGKPAPHQPGSVAAMFTAALPPLVSPPDPNRLAAIGPNILGGRVRRSAEGGVYIGQARLRCYKTNSDPDACGRNLWGGNTRAGLIVPSRPDDEWRAARAEFHDPRPPATAHPQFEATKKPGGTPPGTGEPRGPALPTGGPPPSHAITPANCPAPPIGRTVFILDGSLSMGLPLWVGADLEDRLDAGILKKQPGARRRYRELLAEPGPKRITRAREAFAAAAKGLPNWVELGLVIFRECKDIRKVGVFQPDERSRAIAYVRSLIPRGRTPIAGSLRAAATMLGDGPSSIVLLTDGREFCGGDPCAAAAEIHGRHPQTPISVVDISGQAKAQCIADATGGRVYSPGTGDDLARVVQNAFRGADANCPLYAGDTPEAGNGRTAR